VIEVNPRPGAAIDLFDAAKLWTIHIDAVSGNLPQPLNAVHAHKRAAGVLYADAPMLMPSGFVWPSWAADLTPGGRAIPRAAPICTVFAEADLVSDARALLENRMRSLYKRLTEAGAHPRPASNDTSHTDPSVAV
jgi:predicted ATP-grasp superfamily ATP-dependent carboligase